MNREALFKTETSVASVKIQLADYFCYVANFEEENGDETVFIDFEDDGHFFHLNISSAASNLLLEIPRDEYEKTILTADEAGTLSAEISVPISNCKIWDGSKLAEKLKEQFSQNCIIPMFDVKKIKIENQNAMYGEWWGDDGILKLSEYIWFEEEHYYHAGICGGKRFFEEMSFTEYSKALVCWELSVFDPNDILAEMEKSIFTHVFKRVVWNGTWVCPIANFNVSKTSKYK